MTQRVTGHILRGAVALLAVIGFAGCYLGGTPESGSLTFTMPSSDDLGRVGVQAVDLTGTDNVRIYLAVERGPSAQLIPISAEEADEEMYREVAFDQDGETIEGIPVGDDYRLYAAFGSASENGFDVKAVAWTPETFSVTAGSTSSVPLDLLENGLRRPADDVGGLSVNGLVTDGGTIYLSTEEGEVWTVGRPVDDSNTATKVESSVDTGDIRSVSGGGTSTAVFVNAENGIFEVDGSDMSLSKVGFPEDTDYGTPVTAIEFDEDDADQQRPIAFQTDNGLGFVLDPDDSDSWEFFPTSGEGEDVSFDIPGRPIFDFAVYIDDADPNDVTARAFLATKVGGFAVSPTLVEDLANVEGVVDAVEVFPFYDEEIDNKIARALAYDTAHNVLYVGTGAGAYKLEVSEDGDGDLSFEGTNLSEELELPGRIVDVAVQSVSATSDEAYVAFLSRFSLVVYQGNANSGRVVARIPFPAFDQEPGQAQFLAFRDADGNGTDDELVVAGANGLRTLSVVEDPDTGENPLTAY